MDPMQWIDDYGDVDDDEDSADPEEMPEPPLRA